MTHPVTTSSGTPTANGMPGPAPQPSTGVEGMNVGAKPIDPTQKTGTIKDQPPVTDSQQKTQTTSTQMTGTHLSSPPL